MAQKREKEETELKVPQKSIPLRTPNPPPSSPPSISSSLPTPAEISDDSRSTSSFVSEPKSDLEDSSRRRSLKRQKEVNRCSGIGCRRKVGLIGFRCRCGDVFCSEHRYSDRHECSFDYKAAGREAIARENPVVRAAKILKV